MESNQNASGDELTGTQKEAQLRALMQRTGYQLRQVCRLWLYHIVHPLLELFGFILQLLWSHVKLFQMNVRKLQCYQTSHSHCVSGERPAAIRRPSTWLEWSSTRKRERDLCGETAQRSVRGWTGAAVREGDGGKAFTLFLPFVFKVALSVFSLVKSTRWGWWWTSAGTTEATPSSPSATNRRPKQRWSSSTTTRSGDARDWPKRLREQFWSSSPLKWFNLGCLKRVTERSRFASIETDASLEFAPASTTAACLWVGFPKPKTERRSWARWRRSQTGS